MFNICTKRNEFTIFCHHKIINHIFVSIKRCAEIGNENTLSIFYWSLFQILFLNVSKNCVYILFSSICFLVVFLFKKKRFGEKKEIGK